MFDDVKFGPPAWLLPSEKFEITIPLDEENYGLAMSSVLHYGVKLVYHVDTKATGGYEIRGTIRHGQNTIDRVVAY